MIIDAASGFSRYEPLHKLFPDVARFLARPDLVALPDGRHEIAGEDLFAIVMRANGKSADAAQLEIHDRYIDVQLVLEGTEEMGWKPRSACTLAVAEYDAEKDFQLFQDLPQTWAQVHPGQFALFFPEDAHAPLVSTGMIHKIVVKVATLAAG